MPTLCSFDVFDTCLTRRLAVPSGVFHEVARRAFAKLDLSLDRPHVEDFIAARIQAEQVARRQSDREDIGLDDIWRNLIHLMGWPHDPSLAGCELDAEEELLVPIASIRRQVQTSRERGCRIIFVSDMYLPTAFIERQLVRHGFAQAGDGIYVSGDIGKAKTTGNLFRHLLALEKVAAADVQHTGDNEYNDYAVPRRLGIRARLFSANKLTRAEIGVIQTRQDSPAAIRIAGAMRAFRLGCASEEKKNINELASQFVAPFVMGFVSWVLRRAQEQGIKRLYFVARDCQIAWKVARELAPQFGGIDCRYLYVSRQALFLPSAASISPEGMPWMRRSFEEPDLKNLLAKIDLTFEDVPSLLAKWADRPAAQLRLQSEEDWRCFWEALNEKSAREKIQTLIASRQEAAREYFAATGLSDPVPWALVDLGWTLRCQQSLRKLFNHWGWPDKVAGYYLGLKSQRVESEAAGMSEALFYQSADDFPPGGDFDAIFNYLLILEHTVGCADHPTVHHYGELDGGGAGPAYRSPVNEATLNFCHQLHHETLAFISQNQTLVDNLKDDSFCRELLSSVANNFFKFPSRDSVHALAGLSIAVDQNGLDSQPLVKPLSLREAILLLLPGGRPFNLWWGTRISLWLEGSVAMTSPWIKSLAEIAPALAAWRAKIRRWLSGL